MYINSILLPFLVLTGWLWTLRAGATIQKTQTAGGDHSRRLAIGGAVLSGVPLMAAVIIAWPK
jgi:hypothetical protein